jgi:phosphoribosylformimino-5-aminoimidazole carboxamide ribotide isomerase
MIVIPAVDIRDGRCVRLRGGRADQETVFADDPVSVARHWCGLGATRLHVVDLDGAFAGAPRQAAMLARLVTAVAPVPVQVGGGLRDLPSVQAALATGARWVVLGTQAALDPAFLTEVCRAFPDRVIVAVDGRGQRVAVKGWTETAEESVSEVARRARAARAAAVLYTDVDRDGTGRGPNLEDTGRLAGTAGLPVIASGGVSSLEDLRALAAIPGVLGTVVGQALYAGAIDLKLALAVVGSSAGSAGATEPGGGLGGGRRGPLRS